MKKLLMLAIAAMAFAIPASASAGVFTHEGLPIEGSDTKTVSFKGPAAFEIPGAGGVHCNNVTASLILKKEGTGTVEEFETNITGSTQCTTTPDNFVAHTEPIGLPWVIHSTANPDIISITGVDIINRVTHPATPHLVVAERRLTGTVDATIPAGQTENIQTVTLSGTNAVVDVEGTPVGVNVSGDLTKEGSTQVGVE